MRCAQAVGTGVSTTENDYTLALSADAFRFGNVVACDEAILLGQEVHSEMNAVKLTPRHGQVARYRAAAGQDYCIEVVQQLAARQVNTHIDACFEGDALCGHLIDAPLHYRFF